jgi:hypothetical protein
VRISVIPGGNNSKCRTTLNSNLEFDSNIRFLVIHLEFMSIIDFANV